MITWDNFTGSVIAKWQKSKDMKEVVFESCHRFRSTDGAWQGKLSNIHCRVVILVSVVFFVTFQI